MCNDISSEGLIATSDIDEAVLIDGIVDWVEMETPSDRPDLIERLLDHVEAGFVGIGVERTRLPPSGGCGGQLILRYAPAGVTGQAAFFLGHLDTVWNAGTLAERPVRRDGDRIFGPGIFDMKAGSYLAVETLRRIAKAGLRPPRPIVVYLNADEEIGSPVSRSTIEALAADAAFAVVPEPSYNALGTVVTSRKGWGRFRLQAKGRSAHAGGNLSDGRSAIVEIARHVLEIEALTKTEPHATFNVGVVAGGTRTNVVPEEAYIDVDMRVDDIATAERLTAQMLARKAHDPDVKLTVQGGMNRPPFERSAAIVQLYSATQMLARRLQQPIAEMSRGGVSDGNIVAASGVPVLDGMGCNGGGAHALEEHILASTVAPRHALMHAMMLSEDFQRLALANHR